MDVVKVTLVYVGLVFNLSTYLVALSSISAVQMPSGRGFFFAGACFMNSLC